MAVRGATALFVGLLGLAVLPRVEAGAGEVVSRVVTLIEELKEKINQDGKIEQKMYDKFACWCESTTARKAEDIHQAMADIKDLSSKVLATKGLVATRTSEVSELSKAIRAQQKQADEATAIRSKENAAFAAEEAEMKQTLGALGRAIKILGGAGTKSALLQMGRQPDELSLLDTAAQVHEIMSKPQVAFKLTAKQLSVLAAFTADPAEYYDQKAEKKASYSPASATIQGILKDMYNTFSQNLETSTEVESTKYKDFEGVISASNKEVATLSATRTKKEGEKADAAQVLADTAQDLDDTKADMDASVALFDNTKKVCNSKAFEWNERVRARTEELAGIEKALEILTSDDAKALFNKAIKPGKETMFLQEVSVHQLSKPEVQLKVYNILKKAATQSKSLRLAAIATQVRASGHFDVVVKAVEKMIGELQAEQKDDFDKKDWCKQETFKNEQEAARYQYKVDKLDAKLAKFNAHLEELERTKAETINQITAVTEDIAKMESTRSEAHSQYTSKRADDEGAVQLLEAAIESLAAFYKNNEVETGPIQGSINLLQKGPTFEVSADQAPDATFTSAGKSGGEAKGILSTMTMIKEDLEDEIANGIKSEETEQMEFGSQLAAAKKLKQDLEDKKTNLQDAIANTNDEINVHEQEKSDEEANLAAEHEYLWSIKPDCTWVLTTFDERRHKRDLEIDGLRESIAMLMGAQEEANAAGEPLALAQKPKFDDDAFDRLSFRS